MTRLVPVFVLLAAGLLAAVPDPVTPDPNSPRPIDAVDSVFIEDLTWMEIRDAHEGRQDTVIVATGGSRAERALPGDRQAQRHSQGHDRGDRPQARQRPRRADRPFRARRRHRPAVVAHEVSRHDQPAPRRRIALCSPTSARASRRTASNDIVLIGDSGGNQDGLKAVADELERRVGDGIAEGCITSRSTTTTRRRQVAREPGNQANARGPSTTTSPSRP